MNRTQQTKMIGHALLWRPKQSVSPCRVVVSASQDGDVVIVMDGPRESLSYGTDEYYKVDDVYEILDELADDITTAESAKLDKLRTEDIPLDGDDDDDDKLLNEFLDDDEDD